MKFSGIVAVACLLAFEAPCSEVRVCRGIAYKPDVGTCVLDLSVPTTVTGFPTVVWFHGGGLTGGHRHFIDIDTDRIAVAAVEYRLMQVDDKGAAVPGGEVSPAMILDDCAAAAAWVKRNIAAYGGDAKRVFISGHSAGGYVTHLLGLDPKWLKPHGLTPFDFAGYLPISGQATKHFAVRQYFGQGHEQMRPVVDEWAPIHHIAAKTPPFCLLLGDRRIEWPMRVEESEFMYLSMKALGNKSVEFHSFPGTNHGTCLKPSLVQLMNFIGSYGRIRAVQVDLARQMETTAFLSNYVDRVAGYGINTLQLYLEGRVGTKTFSLPDGERYTAREMRDLVAHASVKGVTVIPVVSLLGHSEQFFKYPGHEDLSEESCGRTRWGERPCTFCLSNPKTRTFLENYVAELCEIFPGPYFHVGFDESWNMGFCDRCAAKAKKDGGDDLFAEFVIWAHDVCKRHGKRMMMWDDFFGVHPAALDKVPRDVIMCQWNYDSSISNRGPRFNFGGNERTDWLGIYAEKGFDALTVSWYETENIRTLADYDRRSKSLGFVVGQWEDLADSFHGGSMPRIPARVLMDRASSKYQAEDAFLDAVRMTYPSLNDREAHAALELLHASPPRCLPTSRAAALAGKPRRAGAVADELAVDVLLNSSLKPSTGAVDKDPLCERALLEDLVMRAQTGLVDEVLRKAVPLMSDVRRTAEDMRAAQSELRRIRPLAVGLIDRRREQEILWRSGCASCQSGGVAAKLVAALKFIDELLAEEARPAAADEKRLELCLTLTDVFGVLRWTVSGRFSDGWRELAKGGWKPGQGEGATFSRFVTFSSGEFPSEIRIDYKGCGAGGLRYLQVESADRVVRPKAVVSVSGDVLEPKNILRDDLTVVRFGTQDAIAAIREPARFERVSSLVVSLDGR